MPAFVRRLPQPPWTVVGDLSANAKVLVGFALAPGIEAAGPGCQND
ncbi:MAG: hypothetical protein ABFC89_08680 [Methanospirillum sp.]